MPVNAGIFIVTREVALRTGDIQNHYRTKDGRFILDSRTLAMIRFTPEEYISGLQGIEKITKQEALELIAKGGYHLGDSEDVTPVKEEEKEEEE